MCHVFQKWRTECSVYGFRENIFSSGIETFLGDTKCKVWGGSIHHLLLVIRVLAMAETFICTMYTQLEIAAENDHFDDETRTIPYVFSMEISCFWTILLADLGPGSLSAD